MSNLYFQTKYANLTELIIALCPSLDCNLYLGEKSNCLIHANDWTVINPMDLIKRIIGESKYEQLDENEKQALTSLSGNMRLLKEDDGTIVGRLFVYIRQHARTKRLPFFGMTTLGGLQSTWLSGVAGILAGQSDRASRYIGVPIASQKVLAEWAGEQACLLSTKNWKAEEEKDFADIIWSFNGNTASLKIVTTRKGWLDYEELKQFILNAGFNEFVIIQDAAIHVYEHKNNDEILLSPNCISVSESFPPILQTLNIADFLLLWPRSNPLRTEGLRGLVLKAFSEVWNLSINEIKLHSNISTDDNKYSAKVGTMNGKIIEMRADIIKRH